MNSGKIGSILPDLRDGLTRQQRIILWCLNELQKELGRENVPTRMLYGRVIEHSNISVKELQITLANLTNKS